MHACRTLTACCAGVLRPPQVWTTYGDEWHVEVEFRELTSLRRLRQLKMEALPKPVCYPLRQAMATHVPGCK